MQFDEQVVQEKSYKNARTKQKVVCKLESNNNIFNHETPTKYAY